MWRSEDNLKGFVLSSALWMSGLSSACWAPASSLTEPAHMPCICFRQCYRGLCTCWTLCHSTTHLEFMRLHSFLHLMCSIFKSTDILFHVPLLVCCWCFKVICYCIHEGASAGVRQDAGHNRWKWKFGWDWLCQIGTNLWESDSRQFVVSISKHSIIWERFPGVILSSVHREA